uniref:Uncharacterized protein n=1 Tax=Electrophorus electricus TaxID=8005 RepID=A0A4W4G7I8_ELEEL
SLKGQCGAAPHAELQVLLGHVRLYDGARRAHGQAERVSDLPHHQRGADVRRPDLSVLPRRLGAHKQAVLAPPLAAARGTVHESRRHVVQLRLVDLLLRAFAPVLKDNGDLQRTELNLSHMVTAHEHTGFHGGTGSVIWHLQSFVVHCF